MALYVMSDTHLSLSDKKHMDVFGSRWTGYVKKIENNWGAVITADDTVVIAGDISWAMSLDGAKADLLFLEKLPGKKIIARGNHDYWWDTAKKMSEFFKKNNILTIKALYNNSFFEQGFIICGSRGWFYDEDYAPDANDYQKIVRREAMRIELSVKDALSKYQAGAELLVFLHFPPVYGSYICREIVDVLKKYGVKRCFYGHIHTVYDAPACMEFEGIKFFMTSADYLNFTPLKIEA